MQYEDLEIHILGLCQNASDECRVRFALDSLRILQSAVSDLLQEELTDAERQILVRVLDGIGSKPADDLKVLLDSLYERVTQDEIRAIELDHRLTFMLESLAHYIDFQLTGESDAIGNIGLTMVNLVDYQITMLGDGAPKAYSTSNMFGDRRMVAEFERQKRLLGNDGHTA